MGTFLGWVGGVKEEENYHAQNTMANRIPGPNSHWDQLQKNGGLSFIH